MKKTIVLCGLVLMSLIFCAGISYAGTEFVSTVMQSGGDYASVGAWQTANMCDLSHSTGTRVFAHGAITGAITDGSTVTGATSGATGIATHVTATQVLIKGIAGTFVSGEQVYKTLNTNYVIVSDSGSPAAATAKIDGSWTTAEGTLSINGWSTARDNYIRVYTTGAARHAGIWDNNKYRISGNVAGGAIVVLQVYEAFVKIDGLQIENTNSMVDAAGGIGPKDGGGIGYVHEYSNCIIRAPNAAPTTNWGRAGVYFGGCVTGDYKEIGRAHV
jgi:hypothetical protein